MARRVASLDPNLLKEFQIIISRLEEPLDDSKIRVLYCHDLPGDPAVDHLKNQGWNKFHKLVFVSNWQMQGYINYYGIPWSKCIVMQNAIDPIENIPNKWNVSQDRGLIKMIYTPTPHRGLSILVPVFKKLCERYDNLELDVYSSFELYGWGDRDKDFEEVFNECKNHHSIHYHGSVSNDVIRKAVSESHIFAYPSIWPETSCLALIEAMSAENICVHSNFAALPETAANWTYMYHFNEDMNEHAKIFYTVLTNAIEDALTNTKELPNRLKTAKSYMDIFYNWNNRKIQWEALLGMLLSSVGSREMPSAKFIYRS